VFHYSTLLHVTLQNFKTIVYRIVILPQIIFEVRYRNFRWHIYHMAITHAQTHKYIHTYILIYSYIYAYAYKHIWTSMQISGWNDSLDIAMKASCSNQWSCYSWKLSLIYFSYFSLSHQSEFPHPKLMPIILITNLWQWMLQIRHVDIKIARDKWRPPAAHHPLRISQKSLNCCP
jgi:hypothetical protein